MSRYEIGFIDCSEYEKIMNKIVLSSSPFSLSDFNVHWIKHNYKDRWFADPFILSISETELILLVEEFFYSTGKGQITKLTIDRKNYHILKTQVLLKKKSHLSFPAIIRKDRDVLIYPENCQTGQLNMYLIDENHSKCNYSYTVIHQPLTDAVIYNDFIFSTKKNDATGNVLNVYRYDKPNQQYKLFQRIFFEENIARNAGLIFNHEGIKFRPAQECNHTYGHCVVLQELCIVNGEWTFTEKCRLYSPHPLFKEGMHTFNVYKNYCVIDVKGFRNPIIKKIFLLIPSILHKNRHNVH